MFCLTFQKDGYFWWAIESSVIISKGAICYAIGFVRFDFLVGKIERAEQIKKEYYEEKKSNKP